MSEDLDRFGFSSYRGFNAQLIRWRYTSLRPHFSGRRCLELGSSDGQGTEFLLQHFDEVTAVDGSRAAVAELHRRLDSPRLTAVCSDFESLALRTAFDTVVLGHVLEHVADPQAVLQRAIAHLAPQGVLIADVPNAMSLHRQMGVELGLLTSVTELNDADRSIGHRRVYTPDGLRREITGAGLRIRTFGGLFLKVLSNAQTEEVFDDRQREAFLALGTRYPDLAAEIFVVATR